MSARLPRPAEHRAVLESMHPALTVALVLLLLFLAAGLGAGVAG
jgi:hypothetical protein